MEFTPPGQSPDAPVLPNVRNEFGTLKVAVISPYSAPEPLMMAEGLDQQEAEHIITDPRGPPDIHALHRLTSVLREHSIRLLYPHPANVEPTMQNFPEWIGNDIYCRDFLGVVDTHAIIGNVIDYRNHNRSRYQWILRKMPSDRVVESPATFSWGNALLVGEELLLGLEHSQYFEDIASAVPRTRLFEELRLHDLKRQGNKAITAILSSVEPSRSVTVFPMNSNGDLDCALAPLPKLRRGDKRRALVDPRFFHTSAADALERRFDVLIPQNDPRETLGCNILWLDPETPIVSTEARHTNTVLRSLGYNPIALPLGTLMQKNLTDNDREGTHGGWRCITGVIERADDYVYE